ncbi:MAG TPA: hypothetical protein VFE50_02980 [Cyclobacteriaceae bacterium]|nr:hypothetical protein [Cyclobacteriaceae bacterium]
MKLRTSKALKFFAILLFSLEMIAPALLPTLIGDAQAIRNDSQTQLTGTSSLTNFITSLLFEENAGEEEERESKDDKHSVCFTDFGLVQAFVELTTTRSHQVAWVEPNKRAISQPALFTLLHTFLI